MRQFSDIRLSGPGWICAWVCSAALVGVATADTPEERAITAIRAAATAPQAEVHPLPLAASWNDGEVATGFGPPYQMEQIRQGRYILPWFRLAPPPRAGSEAHGSQAAEKQLAADDALYYEPTLGYLARHRLPLSFESTQWESIMWWLAPHDAPFGPEGKPALLSPSAPIETWYAVGQAWAHQPVLQVLQRLYANPPRVLFISNNEQPKQSPREMGAAAGPVMDAATAQRRRAIGNAWIERYRALLQGFRDGLTPGWRSHALFIGYDAFITPAMGRWSGWMEYCLYIPGRTDPWAYAWDGASVSYYVHDWAPDSDYTVWSPEVESMNWVAELDQVRRVNPAFWFEISTWDGQQPGKPTDKWQFYRERGQTLTPERYGGMVQFGMWLLRPRTVREFRNPEHDRIRFGAYFDAILSAVARVHDSPILADFWRNGRLLANPNGRHPYESAMPAELAGRPRWFLLDATANPPRPWELMTALRVFSLVLERGTQHKREWLVYAFSPQDDSLETEVQIPGAGPYRVTALRGGSFTLVTEADGKSRPIEQ